MPLQSSGIIVVDKTSVISQGLNNSHQIIQQQQQQQQTNNSHLSKASTNQTLQQRQQQQQQLQNSTSGAAGIVVTNKQQLLVGATAINSKHQLQQQHNQQQQQQHHPTQKGRNLNTGGDDKTSSIGHLQSTINNSSTTTLTTATKNLMRRNQRTISTSSSNSSMNPGASQQTISSLASPSHQQTTTTTTKHIQFSSIGSQPNFTTNQMNQQQQSQQHHIIQTSSGHQQVIVSEEYLEHATATGAAQIVNISANDLLNSQIIKLVSADGNGQNVLIDSLGNVTTTTTGSNANNGVGNGSSNAGNGNSKLLVGNLVLSSASASQNNVNANKGTLTAAGQPQQQINFVSAKQIPYLTTSTAGGNVTNKNQTIQKIVNIPLKTTNAIKANQQHQQQTTFQVNANNQILHQNQNAGVGQQNATGQIIQKLNMPRNVHVVARVQTVSQQQQQSQQQTPSQTQNQLIMQQKFVHGVTATPNKTGNVNMIKKQTVNQMKVQHHKLSNVNIAGQQQQVKTFIHQQQSQPANQQFSTVINQNIQPTTLTTTTTKQLKTQQKVIKQFNTQLGNSTTVTLMQQQQQQQQQQQSQQQQQQQQNQQISSSGTYTINNKISGLPIQQHQRIINTNSGKIQSAINQNTTTTTKYVMQNHIVIPSNGSATGPQTTSNSNTISNQQQKSNSSNLSNSIPNSIVVNQQIIGTVSNSHNNHSTSSSNIQQHQQMQPQSGTIKFVNAHGTVLQTHQQSSSSAPSGTTATVVASTNQQPNRLRGNNAHQQQQQQQHNQQQNSQHQLLDSTNNATGKSNPVNDNHVLYQIQQPTTTFMMNQQSTNSSVVLQGHQQQHQQRSQINNAAIGDNIVIVNGTKMTDEDSARILQSMALKSYGSQRFQQQQPTTKTVQNSQQTIQQQHHISNQQQQQTAQQSHQPNYVISREYQFTTNQQQQQQPSQQQQYAGYQIQNSTSVSRHQVASNQMSSAAATSRSQSISERKRERESKAAAAAAVAAANAAAVAATVNVTQATTHATTNSTNTSEFFRVNSNEIHKNYYSQPTCPTIIDNIPLPRGDNTPAAQQAEHDDDIIGEEIRPIPIATHDSRLQALHAFLQDHTYVVPMTTTLLSTSDILTTNSLSGSSTTLLTTTTTTTTQIQTGGNICAAPALGAAATPSTTNSKGHSTSAVVGAASSGAINSVSSNLLQKPSSAVNSANSQNHTLPPQYTSISSLQQHQQQGQTINANQNVLLSGTTDKQVFVGTGNHHMIGQNLGILTVNSSSTAQTNSANNLIGNIKSAHTTAANKKLLPNSVNASLSGSFNLSQFSSQSGHSNQQDDDANSIISNESNNGGDGRLEMDLGEETETAPEAEAEDDSVTRCICDLTHDDGYMICCDKCFTWQHVDCMGIDRTNIPDEYLCEICQPRPVDKARARSLQLIKRKEQQAALLSNMQFNSVNQMPNALNTSGSGPNNLPEGQVIAPSTMPAEILKTGKKGKPKKSDLLKKSSGKKERVQKRKETKRVNKRKSKAHELKSMDKNADNLRQWIENYEVAVTNHYSPELRARLQAIAKQPNLLQAINAHENKWLRNYYGKFDMDSKGTVIPHAGGKILISNMDIMPNSPIIELRGKYMLTTQFKTQNPSLNLNSPPPLLITAAKNNRTPGPFIFFYQLPVDSASLAAASGANASRGIAALAAAAAVTSANGLSTEICVDTRTYGNEARFVRRSCRPNAELQYSFEKGAIHLFIVSLSNIMSSTEITIRHEPHDLFALEMENSNQNLYVAPTSTVCACGLTKDCAYGQLPQLPAISLETSVGLTKKKSKKSLLNGTLSSKTRAGVKKSKKLQNSAGQRGRSTSSSGESQSEMLSPKMNSSNNIKIDVITPSSNNLEGFSANSSNSLSKQSEEPLKYMQESIMYSAPQSASPAQTVAAAATNVMRSQVIQQNILSPSSALPPASISTQQLPPQLQSIPTIIQPILQQPNHQHSIAPLTLSPSQQNSQMIISQIHKQQQQQLQDKNIHPITISTQQVQHIVQILPSPGLTSPRSQSAIVQLIAHPPQIEHVEARRQQLSPIDSNGHQQQFVQKEDANSNISARNDHNDTTVKQVIVDEEIRSTTQSEQIKHIELQYPHKPSNGQILQSQKSNIREQKASIESPMKNNQANDAVLVQETIINSLTKHNLSNQINPNKDQFMSENNNNYSSIDSQCEAEHSSAKLDIQIDVTSVRDEHNATPEDSSMLSINNNSNSTFNSAQIAKPNIEDPSDVGVDQVDALSGHKNVNISDTPTKASTPKIHLKKTSKSRTTSASEDNSTPNMSISEQANSSSTINETNKRDSRKLTREERKMEAIVRAIEKMEKNQQRKNELKQSKTTKRRNSNSPSSPKRAKTCSQSEDGGEDEKISPSYVGSKSNKKTTMRKKKRKGNRSYAMHTATQRKRRRSRLNSNESDGNTSDESTTHKSPLMASRQSSLNASQNDGGTTTNNVFSAPAQYTQHPMPQQNSQQNQMTLITDLIQSQSQIHQSNSPDANSANATNQDAGLLLAFAGNVDKNSEVQHMKSPPKGQTTSRTNVDLISPQTPSPAISSACLLIESALGPLEGLNNDESSDSFKIPSKAAKTKKSLMSDWLSQSPEDQEVQTAENRLMNDSSNLLRNSQSTVSNVSGMHQFGQNSPKGLETLVQAAMVDYKPPMSVNSLSFIPMSSHLLQHQQEHHQQQIANQPIGKKNCEESTENLCLAAKKVEEFISQNDCSSSQVFEVMQGNSNIQMARDTDSPSSISGIQSENQPMLNTCSNSAAKKRWLRQAISEETDENGHQNLLTSASNSPTSQTAPNGFTTPLKKRRLVVVKNEQHTAYTDEMMICAGREETKNGSDSSNDEYKPNKEGEPENRIKNEVCDSKEDEDHVMSSDIKNEFKTHDSNSADNDVDILGFSSPNRKLNIEENYNLIKIEPEDTNRDIKVDIEKEETLQSPICDESQDDNKDIEMKSEPKTEATNDTNSFRDDIKCDIKSKIAKEEKSFKQEPQSQHTFEAALLLESNLAFKEPKEETAVQTNDSRHKNAIAKKASKNLQRQQSKSNKKPITPNSQKSNELLSPDLSKEINHNQSPADNVTSDEPLQLDDLADIQKTLHSFHTENIMLLQSRNKKTKKTDLSGSSKDRHHSKREKSNNCSKLDTKSGKKDCKDKSRKDKSSSSNSSSGRRREKDDAHSKHHRNETTATASKVKADFDKKNNNEETANACTKMFGNEENMNVSKVSVLNHTQYTTIAHPELCTSLPPPSIQNSYMKVNNLNILQTQHHPAKSSELIHSSYVTTPQNIPSLCTLVGNGELTPAQSSAISQYTTFVASNGQQHSNSMNVTGILTQASPNNSMPYYNTIYGKLVDPASKPLTPTSNNQQQNQIVVTSMPAIQPQISQTSNLLLSDYKSYSTLGAYVTSSSSSSFLAAAASGGGNSSASIINQSATALNNSAANANSLGKSNPNHSSSSSSSSIATSLLDAATPKIITKTASHDPRLNPQLQIPEPAPVPKRKLSINEYRKRKQQSTESTTTSFDNSDSNSSNTAVGNGKKGEVFDDQNGDSSKDESQPAVMTLRQSFALHNNIDYNMISTPSTNSSLPSSTTSTPSPPSPEAVDADINTDYIANNATTTTDLLNATVNELQKNCELMAQQQQQQHQRSHDEEESRKILAQQPEEQIKSNQLHSADDTKHFDNSSIEFQTSMQVSEQQVVEQKPNAITNFPYDDAKINIKNCDTDKITSIISSNILTTASTDSNNSMNVDNEIPATTMSSSSSSGAD